MKKANLFQTQRTFAIFLGIAGLVLLSDQLFFNGVPELNIAVSTSLILVGFMQYWNFKKFYLKYDKKKITWHFPTSEEAKSIDLSDENYEVTQDWKGLNFKGENQSFEISLDQFWERDKNRIAEELKSFYA